MAMFRVVTISSTKSTYRRPASKVTLLLEGTDSSFPGGVWSGLSLEALPKD